MLSTNCIVLCRGDGSVMASRESTCNMARQWMIIRGLPRQRCFAVAETAVPDDAIVAAAEAVEVANPSVSDVVLRDADVAPLSSFSRTLPLNCVRRSWDLPQRTYGYRDCNTVVVITLSASCGVVFVEKR
ncbi:hypothetical protein MRX96_007952 [Rhipicephalus microplus]